MANYTKNSASASPYPSYSEDDVINDQSIPDLLNWDRAGNLAGQGSVLAAMRHLWGERTVCGREFIILVNNLLNIV